MRARVLSLAGRKVRTGAARGGIDVRGTQWPCPLPGPRTALPAGGRAQQAAMAPDTWFFFLTAGLLPAALSGSLPCPPPVTPAGASGSWRLGPRRSGRFLALAFLEPVRRGCRLAPGRPRLCQQQSGPEGVQGRPGGAGAVPGPCREGEVMWAACVPHPDELRGSEEGGASHPQARELPQPPVSCQLSGRNRLPPRVTGPLVIVFSTPKPGSGRTRLVPLTEERS